uniref:Serpentine Receptor, class T n=1 Tax=Panagrellus redivivus TaxID=6233 RepID=A0A7E4UM60_PANRE
MPSIFEQLLLGSFIINFVVYLYVTWITSRLFWHFVIRKKPNSAQTIPMLSMLVFSWLLCAIFGAALSLFNIIFWTPASYNNHSVMLAFFLPAILSVNCVHISQFFITVERIIMMRAATNNHHKDLLTPCIFFNVTLALALALLFGFNFNPNDDDSIGGNDQRMPILRLINMNTYLISYYIANGSSIATLLASLYFLFLFRNNTKSNAGTPFTKMQNTIKYTICIDICLDFLPQISTIGFTLFGSPIGPYIAIVQRVLFTFCGIFINRKFYKVFVMKNNNSIADTSNVLQTVPAIVIQ